jgi:hypothetical protein
MRPGGTIKEFRSDNHYVPRTYLKHWCGEDGQLWVHRFLVSHDKARPWRRASPKGYAYLEHLYTQAVATGLTDEFEYWLESEFEGPGGAAIQKVVDNVQLTPQDWSHLIRFLAAQDVRTPARLLETIRRWQSTLPELLEDSLKNTVQELETSLRENKPIESGNYFGAENLPIKVAVDKIDGENLVKLSIETGAGRGLWMFSIKHMLTRTVRALLSHKWTILHSPKDVKWLTSDDPVVRLNFQSPTRYDFSGGWGTVGTEIFLPLSQNHLLYTKIGSRPPQRGTVVSANMADWLQRFTIEHAHQYVIAASPDTNVSRVRPRIVDPSIHNAEMEQWKLWHEEQTKMEQKLLSKY